MNGEWQGDRSEEARVPRFRKDESSIFPARFKPGSVINKTYSATCGEFSYVTATRGEFSNVAATDGEIQVLILPRHAVSIALS